MVYLWDSMVRVLIYCILIFDLFDFVQLSYMYVTSLLGYLGDLGLLSETYNSSSFLAACVPLMLTVYLASIYTYIFCISILIYSIQTYKPHTQIVGTQMITNLTRIKLNYTASYKAPICNNAHSTNTV